MAHRYVKTAGIKAAIAGREEIILDVLVPDWRRGRPHVRCPYPTHGGDDDWRWDRKAGKAFCSCSSGDSIFEVVRKCEGLGDERAGFEAAKIRVAEMIGRPELIATRANGV